MNTEQENSDQDPVDQNPVEENETSEDEIESTPDAEESLPVDEPWEEEQRRPSSLDDDFDVDAALASIATLSDLGLDDDEDDDYEPDDDQFDDDDEIESFETEEAVIASEEARPRVAAQINAPPMYDFSRGQLASIVPALALMLYGAWLTFTLSSDSAPTLAEAIIVGFMAMGVSLLGYWLSSGRMANGAGMLGFSLIIVPISLYFFSADESLGVEVWPLLIIAFGLALLLSSLLSRGIAVMGGFTGLLLILIGGFAYALTSQILDFDVDQSGEILLPVLAVVAVILLIAPLLPHRR